MAPEASRGGVGVLSDERIFGKTGEGICGNAGSSPIRWTSRILYLQFGTSNSICTNEPADLLGAMILWLGWKHALAEYCVGRSPAQERVPRGIERGVPGILGILPG